MMLAAYLRAKPKTLRQALRPTRRKSKATTKRDWKEIRQQQFLKLYGKLLATKFPCGKCGGPVSEAMHGCPWCGVHRKVFRETTEFPAQCPRCSRGIKLDWHYCPWCYGPGFEHVSDREYSDRRYTARCPNRKCERKKLMPFMRYCPWCHTKVRQKWKIEGSTTLATNADGACCANSGRTARGARRSCRRSASTRADPSAKNRRDDARRRLL